MKTRPLVINKFREYIGDKSVVIQSKRLLEEMKVFIWKNGLAEAQSGYNDDLIMSFAIGMYLRDTSLRFKSQNLEMSRATLSNISVNRTGFTGAYGSNVPNPYSLKTGIGGDEDISWLIR